MSTFSARVILCAAAALFSLNLFSQSKKVSSPAAVSAPAPIAPLPSARQMEWHEMEMNAFIHFTTNTFTDKEWGYGDESPSIFNPTSLDANQWARTLKETGFHTMILTCKHHDGFCLWPSKYTNHSVKASPYKNGKGDIVKEASDAARKNGLKFGVYLSPWDRNRADYGTPSYITYYRNQLKELFTRYGPIFEMWFDGANGGDGYYGGAKEARKINGSTYYDWPTTLSMIQTMQPGVIFFSDAGPGVRWVGNESGVAGRTNWNMISADTLFAGKPGIEQLLNTGSENGNKWIPAEVDVSIRPGWFYHASEDSKVKSGKRLFDIYLSSVGRGSTLLLNIPPDRRGLFHENDVAALREFRRILDETFKTNLARGAVVTASSFRGRSTQFAPAKMIDGNKDTYWATDDGQNTAWIELDFRKEIPVKYVVLQEFIRLGQRVKSFHIEAWKDGQWVRQATETTIGHKRILPMEQLTTSRLRISIDDARACPVISNIEVY